MLKPKKGKLVPVSSDEIHEIIQTIDEYQQKGVKVLGTNLPFLKIPNGSKPENEINYWLTEENEPTSEEELRKFFTKDVIEERLIFCLKINRDLIDGWGMFGYEPGFIFICKRAAKRVSCLADIAWLQGRTLTKAEECNYNIALLPHFDYFPQASFIYQLVTASRTPKTFDFLKSLFKRLAKLESSNLPKLES